MKVKNEQDQNIIEETDACLDLLNKHDWFGQRGPR